MTVGEAIRAAAERLAATSDTARLDAELLMAHALGLTRSDMLLRAMRDPAPQSFPALIERRATHEPVAYITGKALVGAKEAAMAIDPELAENQLIFPNDETLANSYVFRTLDGTEEQKYQAEFQSVLLGA